MKKLLIAAGLVVAAGSLFAQGTNVTEVVSSVGTGVQNLVGQGVQTLVPFMVTIIGIGLIVWFIPTIVGALKSAFGAGKGR